MKIADRGEVWEEEHRFGLCSDSKGRPSPPSEVIGNLDLVPLLVGAPKTIIEIGVGTGNLMKHMAGLGHRCYGVDISETARRRIAPFAGPLEPTDPWPEADLIVSYLCFQHMPDEELAVMLGRIFASLAPAGRLACQYAFLNNVRPAIESFRTEMETGYCFVRSPDVIGTMIDAAGGRILSETIIEPVPGVGWGLLRGARK